MKKGLRRLDKDVVDPKVNLNQRPDEEGIKTSSSLAAAWSSPYLNQRPDEEGIKTAPTRAIVARVRFEPTT